MAIVWEDLQINGLGIYRDTDGFTYGHDAVLLSSFARFRKNETILDIGTGTGILALLVHAKYGVNVDAVDFSEDSCRLAEKSVMKNGLSDSVRIHLSDIRSNKSEILRPCSFDGVVCNPPYYTGGTKSKNELRAAGKHMQDCTLNDFAAYAARMLKNGGKAYFCYPATGLSVFCTAFEQSGLSVKRLCFVRSKREKSPYILLAEAKKGGGAGLIIEDDIILEDR